MVLGESIISFIGRIKDKLRRWNNHNIRNRTQMGLFNERLWPSKWTKFVKEWTMVDHLQATINYKIKLWETINVTTYYVPSSTPMIGGSWISTTQYSSANTINFNLTTHHVLINISGNICSNPIVRWVAIGTNVHLRSSK
jgi:hypothetical protein